MFNDEVHIFYLYVLSNFLYFIIPISDIYWHCIENNQQQTRDLAFGMGNFIELLANIHCAQFHMFPTSSIIDELSVFLRCE